MFRFYNPVIASVTSLSITFANISNIYQSPRCEITSQQKMAELLVWSVGKGVVYGIAYPITFLILCKDVQDKDKFMKHVIPNSKYV